jgi:hypothetical protein
MIWVQLCRATRNIKKRFGVKSAFDLFARSSSTSLGRQSGIRNLPPSIHGFKPQVEPVPYETGRSSE